MRPSRKWITTQSRKLVRKELLTLIFCLGVVWSVKHKVLKIFVAYMYALSGRGGVSIK